MYSTCGRQVLCLAAVGCGQMRSALMRPLQRNNDFWRIGEKGTPWHFWVDGSRFTGVPKKRPPEAWGSPGSPLGSSAPA